MKQGTGPLPMPSSSLPTESSQTYKEEIRDLREALQARERQQEVFQEEMAQLREQLRKVRMER